MKTSLHNDEIAQMTASLREAMANFEKHYLGETGRRQPVHTVYGGAHLFSSNTAKRLGELALRAFDSFADNANSFGDVLQIPIDIRQPVYDRVRSKLSEEAVEDYRIDFEDGYGIRSNEEEDTHAARAAEEVAKGMVTNTLPPYIGIRIKAFSNELISRSLRTLDIFLTTLLERTGGKLPDNFVITLPKIVNVAQIHTCVRICDKLEQTLDLASGSLRLEIMIETTQSIIDSNGQILLAAMVKASNGRCRGAHFGTYDYTASCSITAAYQDMLHPACDLARGLMQAALSGTGVWLSDGATNIMPVAPHRGERLSEQELEENKKSVHRGWKLHYDHCRHSLANGFYQGWDLHPAQLPTRYAAVYTFFLEGLDAASERLRNFVEKAAQATLVGDVFDDAATGQGLLNYFLRAINCGAITEDEASARTGITVDEFRSASFLNILKRRQKL